MTRIVRITNADNDGIFNEEDMLWLICDPPPGWEMESAICNILKNARCPVTPKIMAALVEQPWHVKAIEAICLGTFKRKP